VESIFQLMTDARAEALTISQDEAFTEYKERKYAALENKFAIVNNAIKEICQKREEE
jgi:hypothetical protein